MFCLPDADRAVYTWPALYMAWFRVAGIQGRKAAGHAGPGQREQEEGQGHHTSYSTP